MEEKKSVVLEIHDSKLELSSPTIGAVEEPNEQEDKENEDG